MRKLRSELLKISEEQGRVIMLSARVPDCLKGCYEDGLDIEQWIHEELVDCLTLGSRSFDIKVDKYVKLYGLDPDRDNFVRFAKDDFTGINDRDFLEKQDKTYVIDRKGGYPWGIGYGNMNADRQLPCVIEKEGEVLLYVAENVGQAKKVTLKLLFEELESILDITFNGKNLIVTSQPYRDLQVTTESEAPISGYKISQHLCQGIDLSKPCTMLTADLTGLETVAGYQKIQVITKKTVRLEKVELELVKKRH